jgi:hypothetical protein
MEITLRRTRSAEFLGRLIGVPERDMAAVSSGIIGAGTKMFELRRNSN